MATNSFPPPPAPVFFSTPVRQQEANNGGPTPRLLHGTLHRQEPIVVADPDPHPTTSVPTAVIPPNNSSHAPLPHTTATAVTAISSPPSSRSFRLQQQRH